MLVNLLLVIIVILLLRGPKEITVKEYEYIEIPVPVETPVSTEDKNEGEAVAEPSKKSNGAVNAQAPVFQDMKGEVEVNAETTSESVEGSEKTSVEEMIASDSESAEAAKDIKDSIEDEKIESELGENPNKEVVSDPTDAAVVIGDENTGSNPNTVPEEEDIEVPFENVQNVSSEEEKKEQETVDTVSEEKEDDIKESNGAFDLFADDDTEDAEDEVTEEMPEFSFDSSDENKTTPVFTEESKENEEAANSDAATITEEKNIPDEAPKAGKLVNSYLKVNGNIAYLEVAEGEFVSGDAGDGVIVEINNNVIKVELEEEGTTVLGVDLVDSLGNLVTAIVSFN